MAFLPAERLLDTIWQGGKRSTELWMVSLFKSQRFQKKNQAKQTNHNCVNGVLKLSTQLKQHTVSDVVVHQDIYTASKRTDSFPDLNYNKDCGLSITVKCTKMHIYKWVMCPMHADLYCILYNPVLWYCTMSAHLFIPHTHSSQSPIELFRLSCDCGDPSSKRS